MVMDEFQESVLIDNQLVPIGNDEHLAAYKANKHRESLARERLSLWEGIVELKQFSVYDPYLADPHLTALRHRQGKSLNHEMSEAFSCDRDDPRLVKWREERQAARDMVEIREKMGLEVAPELRAKAEEPDRFDELESIRTAITERRQNVWIAVR